MARNLEGETIAAIATPLGTGGVGIVRISGASSKDILQKIFKPSQKSKLESHKATIGWVVDNDGDNVDKALVTYMKNPNSYTGEDVVEISCHGGPRVIKEVLDLSIRAGARLAERGEFTKRALLNGRMDLTQAEAVLDLIGARTKEGLRSAASQLGGELSENIKRLKDRAVDMLARLEASIDFPDEVEGMHFGEEAKTIEGIKKEVEELLSTADYGRLYREGMVVAITGKSNVGKSSILNAILREERAIVTEHPGTTRDTIEEGINIKGIPVNLIDTAGLRISGDHIEKIGIDRAKKAAEGSDVVVVVIDASDKISEEDKEALNHLKNKVKIIALNKIDLVGKAEAKAKEKELDKIIEKGTVTIRTSAITGEGIKEMEEAIFEKATENSDNIESRTLVNSRHKECLIRAKESLQKCMESVRNRMQGDFIAIDLKAAISALGEIMGEEASEEVIDRIFEQFCVGK